MSRIVVANDQSIQEASDLIRKGEIVVLPTETVYGLGADATSDEAVKKIFQAKQRPAVNPLIIHLSNFDNLEEYADSHPKQKALMSQFCPGPLTFILNKKEDAPISKFVTAGLDTIAIRFPAHPAMKQVIERSEKPIAAPSANRSGEPSATTPQDVAKSLGKKIDMILAAGKCDVGLESTVLDLSGDTPTILRPGAITKEKIEEIIGEVLVDEGNHEKPKSPGQLLKHYAPSIPVRLNAVDVNDGEALLAFGSTKFMGLKKGGAANELPEES
ncbi:MAG: L-threonylcarbamoyladenylate synthase, partial [Pseudomonadota bacterium]